MRDVETGNRNSMVEVCDNTQNEDDCWGGRRELRNIQRGPGVNIVGTQPTLQKTRGGG